MTIRKKFFAPGNGSVAPGAGGGSSSSGWSSWLNRLQTALDIAGFVGPVGPLADAANAGISLLRGDYVGAGVNAVAILPVVGDAFKAGKMVAKGADKIGDVAGNLSTVVGKNRITIQTPSKEMNYDLVGKPHFDKKTGKSVDTPHVHEKVLASGPNGKINIDGSQSITRQLTFQDIRIIKRYLKLE